MALFRGTNFSETIRGSRFGDDIFARNGDDTVEGRGGADFIDGGGNDDDVGGGSGNDEVRGGDGDDTVRGDSGRDELFGGKGDDLLIGGSGADRFNFIVDDRSQAGFDTIADFDQRTEFINLGNFGSFEALDTDDDGELTNADAFVTVIGKTTTIDVGAAFGFSVGNEVLTVRSAINSPLREIDFVFDVI